MRISVPTVLRVSVLTSLLPASVCSAQILIPLDSRTTTFHLLAGQLPRPTLPSMTNEEWAKFGGVYDTALASDRAMDAEGDNLSAELGKFENTLANAMFKTDPQVGPALQAASKDALNLTNEQRSEFYRVEAEALQADPKLQAQWDDLAKRLIAHQQRVDAKMLKLDPTVAPILDKIPPGKAEFTTGSVNASSSGFNPGSIDESVGH
jgi:hypothetical protein